MNKWYVVHTRAGAEQKAVWHLANQGFEVYFPRIRRRTRHARRTQTVARALFPRYLFVNIDLEAQAWRSINGTVGVQQIVCQGDAPLCVPDGVVGEIRAREDDAGFVVLEPKHLKRGDRLRMIEGALSDLVGIFEEAVDDRRVVVLFHLLGRQVRLEAPLRALAVAEH